MNIYHRSNQNQKYQLTETLKRFPIFSGLKDNYLDDILEHSFYGEFNCSETLQKQGLKAKNTHLLISGSVINTVTINNTTMLLRRIREGELIGLTEVILDFLGSSNGGITYLADAIVEKKSKILALSRDNLEYLLGIPELHDIFMREVTMTSYNSQREMQDARLYLNTPSSFDKIVIYVERMVEATTQRTSGTTKIEIPTSEIPTHRVIGAEIGASRETVTRKFNELKSIGVIAIRDGEIEIDLTKLIESYHVIKIIK